MCVCVFVCVCVCERERQSWETRHVTVRQNLVVDTDLCCVASTKNSKKKLLSEVDAEKPRQITERGICMLNLNRKLRRSHE